MTIRIITLGVFTLLCCMAGGVTSPRLSFAADAPAVQAESPAAPAAGHSELKLEPGTAAQPSERRDALREQLMKLPPEQRRAKIEEMKQQVNVDKAQRLQHRKDEFQSKWDKASPEDRVKFCESVKQKCTNGGKKFACDIAQDKCQAAGKGQ